MRKRPGRACRGHAKRCQPPSAGSIRMNSTADLLMVIHEQSRGRKNFMSNLRLLKKPDKKIQDALDEPESSANLRSFFGSSVLKVRTEVLVSETKPAGFAKGQGSQRELLKKPLKRLRKKVWKRDSKKLSEVGSLSMCCLFGFSKWSLQLGVPYIHSERLLWIFTLNVSLRSPFRCLASFVFWGVVVQRPRISTKSY